MTSWQTALIGCLLIALLVAACGSEEDPADPAYQPGYANYPTEVPACQALNGFDSYRYKYNYRWFSPKPEPPLDDSQVGSPAFAILPNSGNFDFAQDFDGAVINPDRVDILLKTREGLDLGLRWVGGEQWTNAAGAGWVPAGEGTTVNYPPAQVCDAVLRGLDLTSVTPTRETIGELEVDHYHLEDAEFPLAAQLWEPQSDPGRLLTHVDLDIWLTADGWPARLQAKSQAQYPSGREFSGELALEISDVNNDDISIEPPELP